MDGAENVIAFLYMHEDIFNVHWFWEIIYSYKKILLKGKESLKPAVCYINSMNIKYMYTYRTGVSYYYVVTAEAGFFKCIYQYSLTLLQLSSRWYW